MDEVLRQSLAPVLRDLGRHGFGQPTIEDVDWTGDEEQPSAMLRSPDGSGTGVSVRRSDPPCERIAAMADQVQEWAVEEYGSAGASNWPVCPRHPQSHPMRPTTSHASAMWVCPTSEEVLALIGAL